ncbi:MAG: outer rane receptor for ferrienterochelin and colicin, partial [Verrucomicrobia bacterium]|nr:outer rane receptor for ferrienterochelin and colicin [Verrucomicrobiota bacterium]
NEAVVDVDLIDRVEIIRGPSSSIYGNSAFFGVINILPKRGGDINGTEISTEAGSLGTYKTRLTFGKKFGQGPELLLSASHSQSEGQARLYYPEYDTVADNHGVAVDSDRETADHFYGSLSYRDFVLSGAYSKRTKRVPAAPSGTAFNSGLGETQDERAYVDLKFEHEFPDDLKVMARVSYDRYPYEAVYPYANSAPPPDLILNQDRSLGEWARAEVQVTKRLFDRHTLILGAEYEDALRLSQSNFDQDPYTSYLQLDHGDRNFALYSQGEFSLGHDLLLNAGLRYDHFESFGGTVNPRLGLIYNPWAKSTFKALYGEAFRAPNDYELNFQSPIFERNPGLRPVTIRTYEVVYEQYLRGHLRLSAAAYHYDINGLIEQAIDPVTNYSLFENHGRVQANGVELQLEGRYRGGVLVRTSYALQRSQDLDEQKELSNSPRHLAKLNVTLPLYHEQVFGSVELQYRGSAITPDRGVAKGYTVVNGTLLAQKLAPGLELSASVYNIFDTHYSTPSSGTTLQDAIAQNGRTFRAKLTYKF